MVWWVQLMVVAIFSARVNVLFKELQGHAAAFGTQRAYLDMFQMSFLQAVEGRELLAEDDAQALYSEVWIADMSRAFAVR